MGLRRAILLGSIVLFAATAAWAATATATSATAPASTLAHVESALRADHVYVDPRPALEFPAIQQQIIGDVIRNTGQSVYVAVLDARGRAAAKVVARQIARQTGRHGTYVVFVGKRYWITSDVVKPAGAEVAIFRDAMAQSRPAGLVAVFSQFVVALEVQTATAPTATSPSGPLPSGSSPPAPKSNTTGGGLAGFGGVIAFIVVALAFRLRRILRRRVRRTRLRPDDNRDPTAPVIHQTGHGSSQSGGHGHSHGHHGFDSGGGGSWLTGGDSGGGSFMGGGDSGGGSWMGGGDSGGGGFDSGGGGGDSGGGGGDSGGGGGDSGGGGGGD